jgi:uncharacterized protein YacL (UPF0231 family)
LPAPSSSVNKPLNWQVFIRFFQAEHEVNSDKVKHLISDLKTGKETLELQLRQLEKEKEEASIRIQDLEVTVQSSQVQNQEHSEEWVNKLRIAEEACKVNLHYQLNTNGYRLTYITTIKLGTFHFPSLRDDSSKY